MGGTDELQELVRVLADVGLGVVAGDVVPFDSVLVDVVEDSCYRQKFIFICRVFKKLFYKVKAIRLLFKPKVVRFWYS